MTKQATKTQKKEAQRPVLPLAAVTDGHVPRHIDMQLSKEQGLLLLQVREGLLKQNARLESGRPVFNNVDTVRWLFENLKEYVEYENV